VEEGGSLSADVVENKDTKARDLLNWLLGVTKARTTARRVVVALRSIVAVTKSRTATSKDSAPISLNC
jgi:hypothetical protein